MGAQLLGFTGIDGEGLHGLELQYDEPLSGEPGRLALEQSPGGLTIAPAARELVPPEPGSDLVLTVDREVQHAAEEAARGAMEEFSAVGAAVVVMEVETGEVLALASEPGFDPNDLDSSDPANRRNRAVTDAFEPGSVQKAVTAAAALEEGVVTPDTTLVVDDEIRVGNKTFSDAHRHDPQRLSFRQVIERSSNVGTIMVAQRLGERRLSRYLRAFGYGQPPGTGFPGESSGLLLPVERWWATSLPTIAIGQGVAVTPLQTATFYAALANDGVAVEPRLVRGTVGTDGRLAPSPSAAGHRVVSERSARQLQSILGDVVSGERGTGARAAVPGYTVAGKTGTARKPRRDARGYSSEHVASFVGFAPVEDPKVVVSVMVDEPEPIWGGVVAAPVFSDVMEFALVHRRVPPSRPRESLREALAAAERQAAEAAARREGPATDPDQPGSPPVGEPAAPAASGPDAADAPT